jgi:hypothetical protein
MSSTGATRHRPSWSRTWWRRAGWTPSSGPLRRLYRTTPQGRPLEVEREVERRVIAREAKEVAEIETAEAP